MAVINFPPEVQEAFERRSDILIPPCLPIWNDRPRRLVNHFKVGADPEFHLVAQRTRARIAASEFVEAGGEGIYGADGSGRQAEIRAYPSRSVLEVVTSLGEALYAFYANVRRVRDLIWWPVPFAFGDGCGGHIHFGRTRKPLQKIEVARLNNATRSLLDAMILDSEGQHQRVESTRYGNYGDVRAQPFGYEYRTMPVWLQSPATAHCVLTAAKLAVLHNGAFPKTREHWALFFRLYAGKDDDARLAQYAVQHTQCAVMCCRPNWGLTDLNPTPVPAFLAPPSPRNVRAVETSIRTGSPVIWPTQSKEPGSEAPFDALVPDEYHPRFSLVPWEFGFQYDNSLKIPQVSRRFWNYTNSLWKRVVEYSVGEVCVVDSITRATVPGSIDLLVSRSGINLWMHNSRRLLPVAPLHMKDRSATHIRMWHSTWVNEIKWEEVYVRNSRSS
jgi:hypothetical protein